MEDNPFTTHGVSGYGLDAIPGGVQNILWLMSTPDREMPDVVGPETRVDLLPSRLKNFYSRAKRVVKWSHVLCSVHVTCHVCYQRLLW